MIEDFAKKYNSLCSGKIDNQQQLYQEVIDAYNLYVSELGFSPEEVPRILYPHLLE